MKFLRELILPPESQASNSATKSIELPRGGVLSALILRFSATNGSSGNVDNEIFKVISKIEVVGPAGEVYYSLNGREAWRYSHRFLGKQPEGLISEAPNATQFIDFVIPFGRSIGDTDYALNLEGRGQCYLKVTYNLAAVRSVGNSGYVSGSAVIEVIGYRAQTGTVPTPRGYLKTTEIYNFTSAASGTEQIAIFNKNKLREIIVEAYEPGTADGQNITRATVYGFDPNLTYFDGYWTDIQTDNVSRFGIDVKTEGISYKSNTGTIETWTGNVVEHKLSLTSSITIGTDASSHYQVSTISGGQLTLQGYLISGGATWAANTADTTARQIHWSAKGYGIGNTIIIPLYMKDSEDDYLDGSKHSKVLLELTENDAGATVSVILNEVITR